MLGPQRAYTYLVQGLHLSVDEKTSEKKPRRQGVHTVSMLSRTVRHTHKSQQIKSRRHLETGQDGFPLSRVCLATCISCYFLQGGGSVCRITFRNSSCQATKTTSDVQLGTALPGLSLQHISLPVL